MRITYVEYTSEPIRHPVSREMFETLVATPPDVFRQQLLEKSRIIRKGKFKETGLKYWALYFFLACPLLVGVVLMLEDNPILSFLTTAISFILGISALAFLPLTIGFIMTAINVFNLCHQVEAQDEGLYNEIRTYHSYDQYFQFKNIPTQN